MVTGARRLVTAEELFSMQGETGRMELVDGEIVRMAPSGGEHGEATFRTARILGNYLEGSPIGRGFGAETGFLLRRQPDLVRAPDAAFLSRERIPPGGIPKGYVPAVPDLVVEVVSPNDSAEYVQRKVQDWLDAGVRLLWLVYPGLRRMAVHAPGLPMRILAEGDLLDGGEVLPGFACRVADLLPEVSGVEQERRD